MYLLESPLHLLRSGIFPVVPEFVASGVGSGSKGPFSRTKKTCFHYVIL